LVLKPCPAAKVNAERLDGRQSLFSGQLMKLFFLVILEELLSKETAFFFGNRSPVGHFYPLF
jgi:hypothetical protein